MAKLKVFISWAGKQAEGIGQGFHEFLPDLVNAIQPFISGSTIDKGTRWGEVLTENLLDSSCSIVCLTRESINSVWVAFETGAVSRAAGGPDAARARIWTYLWGVEPRDLQLTPFAEYQATRATRDDTLRLVRSINQLSPDPVSPDSLQRRFDQVFWPHFQISLEKVRHSEPKTSLSPVPLDPDFLPEILRTVRAIQHDLKQSAQGTVLLGDSAVNQFSKLIAAELWRRRFFTDAFHVQSAGDGEHLITLGRLQSSVPNSLIAEVLSGRVPASAIVDGMLPKSLEGNGAE